MINFLLFWYIGIWYPCSSPVYYHVYSTRMCLHTIFRKYAVWWMQKLFCSFFAWKCVFMQTWLFSNLSARRRIVSGAARWESWYVILLQQRFIFRENFSDKKTFFALKNYIQEKCYFFSYSWFHSPRGTPLRYPPRKYTTSEKKFRSKNRCWARWWCPFFSKM